MNAQSILSAAIKKTNPAERAAFLEGACGSDLKLLQEMDALLKAHEARDEFMGQTVAAATGDETVDYSLNDGLLPLQTEADPILGTTIGRYTLLKKLGQGGMGSVYLAEQSEPVRRQVALKLIRSGFDSRAVIARFEAERQALAVMDHPHIARIYDGGTTASNQPYFVMELVQGVPITDFCDEHRLSLKQRLEIFVPICQAVQHAHQKGIIHRDLKPGNVLVTEVDGRPVPKVIDFGVAKATEQPLTDASLGDTGAIVGTPTYMSPEQADPTSMDIDTRTDIYALGVMLYELLTGSTPIDTHQFRRGALLEVLRMVREVEPPRPSTKLSTLDALPSIAANRNLEPKQLQAMLRGEIDWIVMKAIDKDRTRRYETANGFAADVMRYLTGEAVEAHPPSQWYQLKKFCLRHQAAVLATTLVAIALLAGIAGTTWGLFEAKKQEATAESRRELAQNAEIAERKAKEEAQASMKKMAKGVEILGSIFKGLKPGQTEVFGKPLAALLGDRLDRAAQELVGDAVGDPVAVARLQVILADSQLGLGYAGKAIALCQTAHNTLVKLSGPEDHDTLMANAHLANAYSASGQYEKALTLYRDTLLAMKKTLGDEHIDTLTVMGDLGETCRLARKPEESVTLLKAAMKAEETKLGKAHPLTLITMNNLALAYLDIEQFNQALPLLEITTKAAREQYGPDHVETLKSMGNLASAYKATKQLDKALPLFESTLKAKRTKLGSDHPETLASMNNLAMGYHVTGQLDKAIPLYEETIKQLRISEGPTHPNTLAATHNLAKVYLDKKNNAEAIKLIDIFIKGQRTQLAANSGRLAYVLAFVGNDLLKAQAYPEALLYIRESLSLREKHEPDVWTTFNTCSMLGEALLRQQKYTEAEQLLLKGYAGMKAREKSIPPQGSTRIPYAVDCLIQLYTETNNPNEVVKWKKVREAYQSKKESKP